MTTKLQTPMKRVRRLGSAHDGVHHWIVQRVTAIALIPLSLWFVYSLATLTSLEQPAIQAWLKSPLNAILLALMLIASFKHTILGMQVVFEDYLSKPCMKMGALLLNKLIFFTAAVVSLFAVVKMHLM
jgi:succinate dehydrogenase / fumarate reductase membrane anchor subunit